MSAKVSIFVAMKQVLTYLARCVAYWLLLFVAARLVFVCINSSHVALEVLPSVLKSWLVGLLFDASCVGYIVAILAVILAFSTLIGTTVAVRVAQTINHFLSAFCIATLPANAVVYSYWGAHFDAASLWMLSDFGAALASVPTWMAATYFSVVAIAVVANALIVRRLRRNLLTGQKPKWHILLVAMLGVVAAMVIPIRGGVGIAPLNTGRAYFCDVLFANHAALNPVWNFAYSLKKASNHRKTYTFMPHDDAEAIFSAMMSNDAEHFQEVDTARVPRPNVIFILLEGFSAHGISFLGGAEASPNLERVRHLGITFDNIMASSDRSGKGLVAALCGHPVLPTISIIQYPNKSQTLNFLPRKLRAADYVSQTFIYGGDLNFNCFNSLVTLAGFDHVIDQDDYTQAQMGDKWGAHDEYTFESLLSRVDRQWSEGESFFDFYFTLSSHEPYTVPMQRVLSDDYLNSIAYTDKCLGRFIDAAVTKPWWQETLIILMADHGHPGAEQVPYTDRRRFNIPLVIVGGALSVSDTTISTYGSQVDVAATLLSQLGISHDEFGFSKDLLARKSGFAFFDYNDGYGLITDSTHSVYDNQARRYLLDKHKGEADTLAARAFLQILSTDYQQR